jgi:hypothetical protein
MFSRVFLAAGVAALAIAAPASAQKGGHGGGNGKGGAQPATAQDGGGGGHGRGGGAAAPQIQRVERQQVRAPEMRVQRQQVRGPEMRVERQQSHQQIRIERQQPRQQARNIERQQVRDVERQQARNLKRQQAHQVERIDRGEARALERQQAQSGLAKRDARAEQVEQRIAANNRVVAERIASFRNADTVFDGNRTRGLIDGCPPGLWMKNNGCMPPGQAAKLIGVPLSAAGGLVPLSAYAQPLSYLYPDTPDYYYRYGNGYLYQVDRGTNLIASLLPLIGGGYLPGQYLPQSYMASYVPNYYGLNSFYPDYGQICNRY